MWPKEVLTIDRIMMPSCTNEKLQEVDENPNSYCPCQADIVSLYCVKIHSILPFEISQKILTILNGACPNISSSRELRRLGVEETNAEENYVNNVSRNLSEDEKGFVEGMESE